MKHVRIVLEEQTEDRTPLCIDTVLRDDRKIAHQIPFAGWWGKLTTNNWLRPVVFKPDGYVRFAVNPEDSFEETNSKCNIFELELIIGSELMMTDLEDGKLIKFILKKVIHLSNLTED